MMVCIPKTDEAELMTLLGIQQKDLDWRECSSIATAPSALVKKLSRLITQAKWTEIVAQTFPALLSLILEENHRNNYENVTDEGSKLTHMFGSTVALSKLVRKYPSALEFAVTFLPKCDSPILCLATLNTPSSTPISKKPRRQHTEFTAEDAIVLLESVLILLKVLPIHISREWSLESFMKLLETGDKKLSWLVLHCVGVILSLSDTDLDVMKRKHGIDSATDLKLALDFQSKFESLGGSQALFSSSATRISLPENGILQFQIPLVSIGGTLVKTGSSQCKGSLSHSSVVQLTSTVSYIREIALSLSSKFQPICLIGPIGCGKSTLLKYTASLFGRQDYPQYTSIQMSDQIDSRLLLGSYHSTDLPGQFLWKPGSLTKAVLRGYWIVLEDVDSAPPDVLALLDGLIDTHKISVPGYGDIESVHPDFRVFATCRTQAGKRSVKLGKQWKRILIESITSEDMKILMSEIFPHLKPLTDRFIGIFEAVASFQSDLTGRNGRIVSLRDFLKFCRRIPSTLDLTQTHAAISIFQEACALFINSFPSPETRQHIAEIIGTQLNLLRAKAEYFCTTYKPHINICMNSSVLTAGRYSIPMFKPILNSKRTNVGVFSLTKKACNLMETLCGNLLSKEPVLLIGETGVGKTSCVQFLASVLQQKLIVVNLNRQSDSGDLLGGYKPVDLKYIFRPIREEFEALFIQSFSQDANSKFIGHIMTCYANRRWNDLIRLMIHVQKSAVTKHSRNAKTEEILHRWTTLGHQLSRLELQITSGEESPFAFSFIEGTLITAIKNGYWILLDEINLATPEMLQCLSGILEEDADVHLWEKGDETPIKRHPNFHLFAAMNPSTDVGKKDLPLGLRNRFTEVYVEELTEPLELQVLVSDYLKEMALSSVQIERIVEFYLTVKSLSQTSLVDGMGKKPHFSLRTLCRALSISSMNLYGSATRSLYESFCLSFLTQLDYSSHPVVQALVAKHIFGKVEVKSILNQLLPCPTSGKHVQIEGYWIPLGDQEPKQSDKYILTPSIRRNLKDLARIISAGRIPILIQGETSVGKTSLIQYVAQISGNNCYRINNHQHTDLQEYIGSYQSDSTGKLVFTEGILVTAMRRGEWIILDELNLAPSEVLEALNRLLDDNRQLFITETGQTVTAHPRFMLFATQNPPGLYGGRKILSRAFRNRFVELHFDEIPTIELETILHHRCNIPQSYCKKIIGVLRELQVRRKASAALEGKHGFATLRDLFRWAERYRQSGEQTTTFYDWDQHLADEGYLVLAGKVRKPAEAEVIREVLQKHLKRTVDPNNLFSLHEKTSTVTRPILEMILKCEFEEFKHIVWTFQMRRLGVLIGSSLKFKEPILLVGETGGGKTSIVQLLTRMYEQKLFAVNCHMHSEGSDFLGGLRPVRNHQENDSRLFEWVDGPLVEAMEGGGIFLADEISLADDSVLERINSVLEPERTLLLAEKGDETPKLVVAHDKFQFIGTMNPGGDFGKKELSPALRNRLTEIWCEVSSDPQDIEAIIEHNLIPSVRGKGVAQVMISFVTWLKRNELGSRCTLSIRDYLSWTQFINSVLEGNLRITLSAAIKHGACLAFIDGLGSGTTSTENVIVSHAVKSQALEFLEEHVSSNISDTCTEVSPADVFVSNTPEYIGIGPFFIKKNVSKISTTPPRAGTSFNLEAPTTSQNALRVLRAMQLKKPILLEGSPGVGKTALVTALGKICHRPVVRINLSEQTDISDLFGADLPVEGGSGGHFEWRDGPLLQALKNSAWILLDELNLASQSVLEGLNACLDHRGEIFVPELNRTFKIGEGVSENRIFGCQNPVRQGGARKGLPKSFLNRFTQVFMDPLSVTDLTWIMQTSFPNLPEKWVSVMANLGEGVVRAVSQLGLFGVKGSPWDFNLRDLLRWGSLIDKKNPEGVEYNPSLFVDFIYGQRMRTSEDQHKILAMYAEICYKARVHGGEVNSVVKCGQSGYVLTRGQFHCGNGTLDRVSEKCFPLGDASVQLLALQKQLPALEALTVCLEMGWMPILVGPTKSGKTSIVKLLAELTGHDLKIMTVSPEMDTIELLGGFEQADIYRKIDETCSGLRKILEKVVKSIVRRHKGNNLRLMDSQLLDLWSSLHSLRSLVSDGELLAAEEELSRLDSRLRFLEDGVKNCKAWILEEASIPEKKSEQIQLIEDELEGIRRQLRGGIRNGAFQWVDSLLVKAIRDGDWLLIDGANRCTAAVLDRLNSLVEVDGTLLLSERGSIDGRIIEMKPHVNFRLILTIDPAYGEISRAMRNRGVEIYMPGPEEQFFGERQWIDGERISKEIAAADAETNQRSLLEMTCTGVEKTLHLSALQPSSTSGINWYDLDALCRAQGCTNSGLRKDLVNLHEKIYDAVAPSLGIPDRPHIYQIIETIQRLGVELHYGTAFSSALSNSITSVYLKGNFHLLDSGLRNQIELLVSTFQPSEPYSSNTNCPQLPASVPNFLSSQLFRIWRVTDILETLFQTPSIIPAIETLKNIKDSQLLEDLLLLSPFLRIGIADASALAGAMNLKFPKFRNDLGSQLASKLDSISRTTGDELPWDPLWKIHYLTKYGNTQQNFKELESIMRTSLLLHVHLFRGTGAEDWKLGTIGWMARAINQGKFLHESVSASQLYSNFWILLEKLDGILIRGLKAKPNLGSLKSSSEIGSTWKKGLGSFFWRKRLFDFAHSERNFSWKTQENAHLILLVEWIGEDVIPFLSELDSVGVGAELKAMVTSCLKQVDHVGGNCGSLDDGKRLRKASNTKPFAVNERKAEFLEEIMELCFSGWSLSSTLKAERLVAFLMSNDGESCATTLAQIFSSILHESNFDEDAYADLTVLKETMEKLRSDDLEASQESEELEILHRNVTGLVEYIRIQTEIKNSPFLHPLLQLESPTNRNALTEYLYWEEGERLRGLFLEKGNSDFLPMACLLPYFVSKILIEEPAGQFRVSTLGSREIVDSSMEKIAGILSRKVMSVAETDDMALRKLASSSSKLLERLVGSATVPEQFKTVLCSDSLEERMAQVGMLMMTFGLELMTTASHLPTVDPAVESKILVEYLAEEINFFESWIAGQRLYELTETGFDLATAPNSAVHPFFTASVQHLKQLHEKLKATQKLRAHRPQPPNYDSIRQDLKQFSGSFMGSSDAITKFKKQVSLVFKGEITEEAIFDTVNSCQIWIDSHRNFVKKISKHFWYWDLTAGFLCASVQVSIGLTLISSSLHRFKLGPNSEQRQEITQLVEFPLQYRGADDTFTNCILSKDSFGSTFTKSIYTASLISFINEIETEGCASSSAILKLHNLSASVAAIWNYQEEEKQKAKDLEDAMYIYKGREKTMGPTEDEQETLDISDTFPDYVEDLIDLEVQNSLESGTDKKKGTQERPKPKTILTSEDVSLFLKIHHRVVNQVKTHWISGHDGREPISSDFITPYLIRFQSGSVKFQELYKYLGKAEENQYTLGAALTVQQLRNNQAGQSSCSDTKIYDFYHDMNVTEVHRLSSVLNGLKKRVKELLLEWSDHPSLLKILEIIARVESFRTTSALMRFLTCLELLLSTSQEWESCAHQGVSLGLYLSEITEIIINWRKLELQCWKNLLEITFQREQAETHKWWFHVYSSIMQILQSPKESMPSEFLQNLHQYMESSSLGQFQTRLDYLFNIHCHLISIQQHRRVRLPPYLQPYIWNTFNYYKQFLSIVSSKLTSLRTPIEKKMKDFVKISRWNDSNYYALKDSVHKNQRMLNKFVKEWKKAMATPVSSILVTDLSGVETQDKLWKRPAVVPKPKVYLTDSREVPTVQIGSDWSDRLNVKRLSKLSKIFSKTQKVIKPVLEIDAVGLMREIEAVEEVTTTIIQDVHELQSVEVAEKSGEKRKKMLHNIHFRKRASLADLFKVLQQLNVSYRRGLVQLTRDDGNPDKLQRNFEMKPVDIVAGWKVLGLELNADKDLVKCWEGCELYFQKCLSRMAVMKKSFESPSKELGPRIIERCKGFVIDLLGIAAAQKEFIADFAQNLWTFRNITGHNYAQGQERHEFEEVYQEACKIEYETKQYILLVESLESAQRTEIINILKTVLVHSDEVKEMLKIYVDSVLLPNLKEKLMEGKVDLEHSIELFIKIRDLYHSIGSNTILGNNFAKMAENMELFITEWEVKLAVLKPHDTVLISSSPDAEKFGRNVTMILRNVLLTFQKLDKLKTVKKDSNDTKGQADETDDSAVTNLKELLNPEMYSFEIRQLVTAILRMLQLIRVGNCADFGTVFSSLAPLFHQYSLTAEFYLTMYIQFHRSTCKLLSVLLGIFATLGSKGFCLPADYEDDAVAEGEEMDASAGMGMGEGETTSDAQDVSDRMESEDQLEDTLKEGEAPPSADKDLNDDVKGVEMSEDFEGKQQDKDKEGQGDENDKEDDSDNSGDEEELDKQMGDVDDDSADKLDDQMWGGSSDEDDEDLNEKDEEQGKGSNRQAEPEMRAKDPTLDADAEPESEPEKNQNDETKPGKEINEQEDEDELNDDQIDPYHSQQAPEEEPEDFDLPDDLNLDGAEPKDQDEPEDIENPFDLDAKEKEDITEVPEDEPHEDENMVDENQVSEDEDPEAGKGIDVEKPHFEDDAGPNEETADENEAEAEQPEPEVEDGGMEVDEVEDKEEEQKVEDAETEGGTESEQKTEDKAEPSEGKDGKQDQTSVANEKAKSDQTQEAMDTTEEEKSKNDETASGQAESKDGSGHEGKSVKEDKNQKIQQEDNTEDASRKPGDTDNNRSLANDQKLPQDGAHRLKTLDKPDEAEAEIEENAKDGLNENNADLYQHVKDSQKSDAVTIDNSTREQAEKQKQSESEKKEKEEDALNPELEEDGAMDESEMSQEEIKAQKPENSVQGIPEKPKSKGDVTLDNQTEEPMEVEIEGDKILTAIIQRPSNSVIETRFDLLEEWTRDKEKLVLEESKRLIQVKQTQLTSEEEAASLAQWHELDGKTLHLAQELCEQLRLVLEPTQAARLKGDYKTGKRLNMRKVIPYIASGFRKDKIWLRRTQPSKREYQILLALDDSASMCDNQSKQMAFSAVAVVARSLSLLEAGQLGVVGFGEDVQLLHPFEEPFTDFSGGKLIQRFTFAQRATRIAQLLEFSEAMFEQAKESHSASSSLAPEVAQLLLIVSDGRGVSHEGSGLVNRAVRHAREKNIFIVFIVVDNPENKDSILDIRLPIFGKDGSLEIAKYMDHFPFPFYLILRDLGALPSVLSDALRQWFELVTSSER